MRRIFIAFIFLFFIQFNYAQISLGVDAGYGSSTLNIPDGTIYIATGPGGASGEGREDLGRVSTFRAGVFGEYLVEDRSEGAGFQVGLIYSDYGFEDEGEEYRMGYLDFEISGNFYFWNGFSFDVGIIPSINISSPDDFEVETFNIRPFARLGYTFFEKYKIYFTANTGLLEVNKEFEMKSNYYGLGVSIPIFELD